MTTRAMYYNSQGEEKKGYAQRNAYEERYQEVMLPLCLYFILYQNEEGSFALETGEQTRVQFESRLKHHELCGNSVLKKYFIESEFDKNSNSAGLSSVVKRVTSIIESKKQKKLKLIKS